MWPARKARLRYTVLPAHRSLGAPRRHASPRHATLGGEPLYPSCRMLDAGGLGLGLRPALLHFISVHLSCSLGYRWDIRIRNGEGT